MIIEDINSFRIIVFSTGYSSVGRAVDCRSIGHLFESGYPDLNLVESHQHLVVA